MIVDVAKCVSTAQDGHIAHGFPAFELRVELLGGIGNDVGHGLKPDRHVTEIAMRNVKDARRADGANETGEKCMEVYEARSCNRSSRFYESTIRPVKITQEANFKFAEEKRHISNNFLNRLTLHWGKVRK